MNESRAQEIVIEVLAAATELKIIKAPATLKRKLKVTYREGYRCWGGTQDYQPVMQIGTEWIDGTVTKLKEYDRIKDDPEIGSLFSDDLEDITRAMICHEIAHVIDYWNWCHGKCKDRKPIPHGSEWRFMYRKLRRHFGLTNMAQAA